MNGSTCVRMALYPHGSRRGFLNCGLSEQMAGSQKVRTRCRLREEPWFMRRLRGAGLELDWRGPCSYRYHPLVVHGLLRFVLGTCYSAWAPWACELCLLWEYYQRPLDAFPLTVAGRFTCVEPQDLCVFQRRGRGRGGGHASAGLGEAPAARLGSNGVAWPADDLVTDRFSCSFERSLARQTVQMM